MSEGNKNQSLNSNPSNILPSSNHHDSSIYIDWITCEKHRSELEKKMHDESLEREERLIEAIKETNITLKTTIEKVDNFIFEMNKWGLYLFSEILIGLIVGIVLIYLGGR